MLRRWWWWTAFILLQCDDGSLLAKLLLLVIEPELGIFRLGKWLMLLGRFRVVRFDVVYDDSSGMGRHWMLRWMLWLFAFGRRILRVALVAVRDRNGWFTS